MGIREPKQERSRQSWERALEVGRVLVEEGGLGALTITEVCRRSGVSPPSLYARVDGLAGLFAAVWERGMAEIRDTEALLFAGLPHPAAPIDEQAAATASAAAGVFERHAAFLRPVISRAEDDPELLERGAAESRRAIATIAASIDVPAGIGLDIAQAIYAECVLRTMYGDRFLTGTPESPEAFRARLARGALARAIAP